MSEGWEGVVQLGRCYRHIVAYYQSRPAGSFDADRRRHADEMVA